jgi:hypothetical protein
MVATPNFRCQRFAGSVSNQDRKRQHSTKSLYYFANPIEFPVLNSRLIRAGCRFAASQVFSLRRIALEGDREFHYGFLQNRIKAAL